MSRILSPGTVYDTGVSTIGGRGQQAVVPYETVQHTVTIMRETTDTHHDYFTTAADAIRERVQRLKESHTPHTVDGNTIRYTDHGGAQVTLTYQEPA